MKKFLFVAIAAMLAIVFSSFTSVKENSLTTIYYHNGGGYVEIPNYEDACEEGQADQCEIMIDGVLEPLFVDDQGLAPYRKE